jgi:hypothetical protein
MAVITVAAVLPISGTGTFTITDTTAAAVDLLTSAVSTSMGSAGSKTTGTVSNSMALQVSMQASMVLSLGAIETNQRSMILALDRISAKLESNTNALGAIGSSLKSIDVMVTTGVADQLNNNKFQQKVTNSALVQAGQLPVTVTAEETKEVVAKTLIDMKNMTTIQLSYKAVDKSIEMLKESAEWTLRWAAETEVGIFFTTKFAQGEALIVGLFSKEKAAQIIRDNEAKVAKTRAGN